ncbi:MAG TPA: glycosyltransferase family 39 protein [Anaerolineaceae bacterium]
MVALLLVGFGLRMLKLQNPPLDFHPTRQLRSAIIARGMYYEALPNADPTLREAAMQTWATMERYEPPVLERLVSLTYRVIGGEHLWVARVYSSLFWVIGGLALYALVRRILSPAAGLFAAAFYLLLPWGVVASRAFQPDPWMVMWVLLAAYALYRWFEGGLRSWLWTVLAGFFCGLAVLIKVYSGYAIAGMALFLTIQYLGEGGRWVKNLGALLRRPQIWVFVMLGALALIYYVGLGDRSTSFASFWILSFTGMLRESKFYVRWLGLIRGIMDVMVFFAALLGAFLYPARGRAVALGLWFGYLMIGVTFPYQIYTHDYYSILLVPVAAFGLAPLAEAVFNRVRLLGPAWRGIFVTALLLVIAYYGYVARSEIYAIDKSGEPYPWQQMGKNLPHDGPIIGLIHDYGNRLKYYGWRSVARDWPTQGDLALSAAASEARGSSSSLPTGSAFETYFKDQTQGMSYFLVTLFADFNAQPALKSMLYDHYSVAQKGDGYILFDLRHPKP